MLTVIVLVAFSSSKPASAFIVCQITGTNYAYPTQVNPGQSVTFSVSLAGSCSPSDTGYYSARVDMVDASNRILKSNIGAMSYRANNGYPFTITIANNLTAPRTTGSWNLQYVVYVFVSNGSGTETDYKAVKPLAIQVGTEAMATTIQNATTSSTASISSLPTAATTNTTSSPAIQPPAQSTGSASGPNQVYVGVAVTSVALIVVVIGLYMKARRNKPN
jgi:hypothetical protein